MNLRDRILRVPDDAWVVARQVTDDDLCCANQHSIVGVVACLYREARLTATLRGYEPPDLLQPRHERAHAWIQRTIDHLAAWLFSEEQRATVRRARERWLQRREQRAKAGRSRA